MKAPLAILGGPSRPPKHGAPWTPDEDAKLRAAWPTGGCDGAADATGRTPAAASTRAILLGLGRPDRGVSVDALRKLARVSQTTLVRALARAGVPLVPRARRRADDRKGRRYLAVRPADVSLALAAARAEASAPKSSPKGQWGVFGRPAACAWHGKADRPHYAKGLCAACRVKAYRVGATL